MRDFHRLDAWNKDRDAERRTIAKNILDNAGIKYTIPSIGHYKIISNRCYTLMFYPKTGTIIWKAHKGDYQHRFTNDDVGKIVSKIKELI